MWPESSETPQKLRSGLTTGSCATACCVAASQALLAKRQPEQVEITLPKGQQVNLPIKYYRALDKGLDTGLDTGFDASNTGHRGICTAIIKDAGDDPDVTHGATVFVELRLTAKTGIQFKAATGVGTVTREGLVLAVGEPAINPVPRKMITEHLTQAAYTYRYQGGFEVSVGVEKGEQIALKTMNPRLGILGGLSILGTTGIVRPYSCSAYIASIRQGIDVAGSNGIQHIAATTGSSSEKAIAEHYQLPEMALIEMGDFVGAVLKHLKAVSQSNQSSVMSTHRQPSTPIKKLSICAGFGKLSKLANGHLDLNSRVSAISFEHLVEMAQQAGADQALMAQILSANTSIQVLKACQQSGIDLGYQVCLTAWHQAKKYLPEQIELEIWAVDRQGQFVGHYSDQAEA